MHQISLNKESGLTLMGVIFAIGIILVGLMGILSLLRYVILASRLSGDRFIATNLAQEGIEIVRVIRDNNWQSLSNDWDQGLEAGAGGTQYQVQFKNPMIAEFSGQPLSFDASNYYAYDGSQNSKYTRRIIIYPDTTPTYCPDDGDSSNDSDNFCVHSEVTWQMLGNTYSALVTDRLYNWQLE